jgi:hypothetical protein
MMKLSISGKYKFIAALAGSIFLSILTTGCEEISSAVSGVSQSLETLAGKSEKGRENATSESTETTSMHDSVGEQGDGEVQATSQKVATASQKSSDGNASILSQAGDKESGKKDSDMPSLNATVEYDAAMSESSDDEHTAEEEFLKTLTQAKKLKEEENNNKSRQPLNLALPSISWEDSDERVRSQGYLPNVFREIPSESKLNLSGKIHWDESEETRQMSVEDTIKGAEVELQFYLP